MLSEPLRAKELKRLTEAQSTDLLGDWRFWARPKQLAPKGDWSTWMIRAGRGFGKTRSGAGFLHERAAEQPGRWMALVARTPADARDYMIEGPGGLLNPTTAPPRDSERPNYEPSKRRITWPNGTWATIYSDDEPDQLRGFSGDTAWLDELAKWKHPRECWDNLNFGMREASGDRPRRLITTTPRPLKLLREIEQGTGTVTVVGSSYENRLNLDPTWYSETLAQYEGTRIGRQEIHAEILEEAEGALWTRDMIDKAQHSPGKIHPELARVVVAIDPAVTSNEQSDETGIVVAGRGIDGRGYVMDDLSGRYTPDGWARRAARAYDDHKADRIIGEVNNGGDLIEHTLRTLRDGQDRAIGKDLSYRAIRASRGKQARAEPVAALYEQGRVFHIGSFTDLEDQMCTWEPLGTQRSPDRVDALVWALTELMLGPTLHGPQIRQL